ncbi:MAG TPA: hypothetical protein VG410_01150 [Solirubrobacteraceae bacterium]|nr:hypothetical protein [Solirubrobacteraceae bacterium]
MLADLRQRAASWTGVTTVAAIAAGASLLGGCGGSSSQVQPHVRTATPLITMFEAEPQLHADPEATIRLLRHIGVDVIKVYLPWGSIAPDPGVRQPPAGFNAADPASYDAAGWTVYDTIVSDARALGVRVALTIGGPPPLWAAGAGAPRGKPHPQWRPSASDYGAFVTAVGRRYSGHYTPPAAVTPLPRVSFWSIWNEPNYGPDLAPQAIDRSTVEVSPMLYRGLLDAAWSALGATGHGHDTILIGELAPRGLTVGNVPGNFSGMVPLRFLRALYCVDGSFHLLRGAAATARGCPATAAGSRAFRAANPGLFEASGLAAHTYPQGAEPPTHVTQFEPDYADFARIHKLEATLDRLMTMYGGHAGLPIYSTEFGYKTDPPYVSGAAPQTAAADINWAEYLSWLDPRVRSFDQYLLIDPPGTALSNFATGLEFASGTPKPSYRAFEMPIWLPVSTFSSGQRLLVWGDVRPARLARRVFHRAQSVQIQFRAASATDFETIRTVPLTDPYGYFEIAQSFPGSGTVRLAWRYPHGPRIFSRLVPVAGH